MVDTLIIPSVKPAILQIGKSKVFLRTGQLAELDAWRTGVLGNAARCIQRKMQAHCARKQFIVLRKATVLVQGLWRSKSVSINQKQEAV